NPMSRFYSFGTRKIARKSDMAQDCGPSQGSLTAGFYLDLLVAIFGRVAQLRCVCALAVTG
ncbi:MAG: hypothetical protein ABWX89_10980, partial [Paeniglutamicibacter terrestris]